MKASEMHAAVSTKCKPPVKCQVVKTVLAALKDVLHEELSRNGSAKLPSLASFRVRKVPARAEGKKMVFGSLVHVSARPASSTIRALPAKQLKDAMAC